MRAWILVLVTTYLAAADAAAAAKEPKTRPDGREPIERTSADPKEAKERAAKKACLTGDPVKGVELLTDLFIDTNDPTYLFNQGRCYEQNNQFENALGRFREYLRKAKQAGDADKNEAKAHIAECLRLLGKKDSDAAEPAGGEPAGPAPAVPVIPVTPPVPPPEPVVVATTPLAPAPAERGGRGLRTAGIVTASLGAAALAAGVILNLKHNSIVDGLPKRYSADDESSSHTYKTMAIVGYAAGAVGLAGGALLYAVGWSKGRVAVVPDLGADRAGAVLGGTF
jgi:tetratricopeptide (TPR) repeat protein